MTRPANMVKLVAVAMLVAGSSSEVARAQGLRLPYGVLNSVV